mgnify:CR=1 FL=1
MAKLLVGAAGRYIYIPVVMLLLSLAFVVMDSRSPGQVGKVIDAHIDNGVLFLSYEYHRGRICDVEVLRQFVQDGVVQTLGPVRVSAEQIRRMESESPGVVKQILPVFMPSAKVMSLRVTLQYECNPLHKLFPLLVDYEIDIQPRANK